jgi:hypothetical protein
MKSILLYRILAGFAVSLQAMMPVSHQQRPVIGSALQGSRSTRER